MASGHFQEFEEEYLETLYEFYESQQDKLVRTGELANALDISPASATEMVQRLAGKGYLNYVPYKGCSLTPEGLVKGRQMKRRHRLLELFLVDILNFGGDVHEAACRLEHAVDDELEWTLDYLLGSPVEDPSGKPIPPPDKVHSGPPYPGALRSASTIAVGGSGTLAAMSLAPAEREVLAKIGVKKGALMRRTTSGWQIEGKEVDLDDELTGRLILLTTD